LVALGAVLTILLLDAMILVASNAVFASSMRSVVLPIESTVRVRNRTRVASPYVITDGQIDYQIQRDMVVEFTRSPVRALLVDLGLESPVEKLSRGFEEQRTS
jgi:NAD kinase